MKNKVFSVLLAVLAVLYIFAPAVFAEGNFVLTLDGDERYTDIIMASDEDERTYFDIEESPAAISKKNYVIILSVLLVLSIGVLIFTLIKSKKLKSDGEDEKTDTETDKAADDFEPLNPKKKEKKTDGKKEDNGEKEDKKESKKEDTKESKKEDSKDNTEDKEDK